jgi:hypothetical protein
MQALNEDESDEYDSDEGCTDSSRDADDACSDGEYTPVDSKIRARVLNGGARLFDCCVLIAGSERILSNGARILRRLPPVEASADRGASSIPIMDASSE